jgi:hypothetical protein
MRSSVSLVGILFTTLLFSTCRTSEDLPVSPSFLFLYNENIILTNSSLSSCNESLHIRNDEPFLVPNSHYCVGQDFVDSVFHNIPTKLIEIDPVDSLVSILVTCNRIHTDVQKCSTLYSLAIPRQDYRTVDSIISNQEQLFWFQRMPSLTAQILNPSVTELDDLFYSTYTYEFENSIRIDTLLTDFNIYLRACDGC